MPTLYDLTRAGQSAWLDTLSRRLLDSGELASLRDLGVRGITDNPTILDKAISGSTNYDEEIRRLTLEGMTPAAIYEQLACDDIRRAADLFRPLYDRTEGGDGYISLEVNPHLAHDTAGTISEARHLFHTLDRPNVLIKVPATREGIPAVEQLISEGLNINITLMFSQAQYQAVAEAYMTGLERRLRAGGDVRHLASVASFFVSRVDTMVDARLEQLGEQELQGKIAIANAKIVYARFRAILDSERWQALAVHGASPQRVLWASTGTKNPHYPATLYVDNLVGPYTVNTMPEPTLNAFLAHGTVAPMLETGLDAAQFQLARLDHLGIELSDITEQLVVDGVRLFSESFDHLMTSIARKWEGYQGGARRVA